MANHGIDYLKRRAITRENMLACREIWTNDEAQFSGEYVNFDSSWSWPKPVQSGGPKVLLGGAAGPKTIQDNLEPSSGTRKADFKVRPGATRACKKERIQLEAEFNGEVSSSPY